MAEKVWRGGMVGAGAWSEVQLKAWAGVKNTTIVALCDRHPERRTALAKRFEIAHEFDNVEAMLNESDLDFVDLCVRPYSHATLIKQVVTSGLPILCQKPFCTSIEEAQAVVALCHEAGARLMVNENFRWQAWYRQAKELLASGALGAPFLARIARRTRLTLPHFTHAQAYLAEMPRLAVYELGVHFLDTFRFLFGEPETIFARLHHISPQVKGEDVQLVILGYEHMTALFQHSWASVPVPLVDTAPQYHAYPPPPHFEIEGTEATLILQVDSSLRLYTDSGRKEWRFSRNARPESHVAAQQHFINCLTQDTEFETSGEDTLKTMALVYAAYLSAEEDRVVTVSQVG